MRRRRRPRSLLPALCVLAGAGAPGTRLARCELLGAAVLPHGDFAYDPALLRGLGDAAARAKAEALRAGAAAAGRFVEELGAEVLILSTPHGAAVSNEIAVYSNSRLSGPALVGRDVNASFGAGTAGPGYLVDFEATVDVALARRVASALGSLRPGGQPPSGPARGPETGGGTGQRALATLLEGWGDDLPLPLRWGEVLPLRLVAPAGRLPRTRLLVLSHPLARLGGSGALAEDLRAAGRTLARLLAAGEGGGRGPRAALVVSTDLAHTHWANTTFGRSPQAAAFDEACGRWAASPSWAALAALRGVVDEVRTCGWLGLPLLQGALEGAGGAWEGKLVAAPAAPTYYGMMAATVGRSPAAQPTAQPTVQPTAQPTQLLTGGAGARRS